MSSIYLRFISLFELTASPVAFLYFASLDVDLAAPAVLLVVFPVAHVVVAIAVDLSPVTVAPLPVLNLAFVDVGVRLREDHPHNAFALLLLLTELPDKLSPVLVERLPVSSL